MEFPNLLDPSLLYDTATSQGFGYWIGLGVDLILSTIIGGLLLMAILEMFSHKFGENIRPANAFLVVLVSKLVINFGILGLLVSVIPSLGTFYLILPVLVWIIMVKAFFGELSFLHAAAVGLIFFVVTIVLLPMLTSYVSAFIPSFG